MSTAKNTILGTVWNVSLNFFNQIAALVIYALLARILSVDEFGLIAFCFLITEMVVLLGNFGVNQILIQRRSWSERLAANCFWFLIILSLFFAILIIAAVAPISELYFYDDSAWMLICLASVPIINSVSLVSFARMQRNFQNKLITKINVFGTTIGGALSIFLVFNGYGVWSVIVGRVLQTVLTSALFIFVDRFVPRYPVSKLHFKHIINFGLPLFYNTCINFFSLRSVNFTTALLLGSTQFAFVSVSQRAFRMISEITVTPLNTILLPGFSRAKQHGEYTSVYTRVVSLASMIILPMYIGVAILADELIFLIFGPKFAVSANLLVLYCFTIIPNILVWFLPALLISRGHTKPVFTFNAIATIFKFTLCGYGALYSVELALVGLLIAAFCTVPIKFYIGNKYLRVEPVAVIKAVAPAIVSCICMFFASYIVFNNYFSNLNLGLMIIFKVLFGALVYICGMILLFRKPSHAALIDLLGAIKNK